MTGRGRWWVAGVAALLVAVGAVYYVAQSRYPATIPPGRPLPSPGVADPLRADEVQGILREDAIRAIDQPGFLSVAQARFVPDSIHVIGVDIDGEAHAYPIPVLSQHEIVNDFVRGRPIAVTW